MKPSEIFQKLVDVINHDDVDSGIAFSVMMKLCAIGAINGGMTRADFLRAADLSYELEKFMLDDSSEKPKH